MATNQNVLAVISSLVTCVQLNVAMLVHCNYVKQRFDILRVLSVSDGRIARHKHLKRAGKQPRPRRFWVRPGRTSLWWDKFISRKVVDRRGMAREFPYEPSLVVRIS